MILIRLLQTSEPAAMSQGAVLGYRFAFNEQARKENTFLERRFYKKNVVKDEIE